MCDSQIMSHRLKGFQYFHQLAQVALDTFYEQIHLHNIVFIHIIRCHFRLLLPVVTSGLTDKISLWVYYNEKMELICLPVDNIQVDEQFHPDPTNTKNLPDNQIPSLCKMYENYHLSHNLFDFQWFFLKFKFNLV